MINDNHAQTLDRVFETIACHEDEKTVADAKRLIQGELERFKESEAAYHQVVSGASCELIIRFGCAIVTTQRKAGVDAPIPGPHPEAPMHLMAAQRVPIRWGGGKCWYFGRCWVCIDWVCGS